MRIYVAGHTGMVGSAIIRQLLKEAKHEVITATRAQVDLTDQSTVRQFLQRERPDAVILAAARVGGIMANSTYPAQFIYENMMIAANVIHQSHAAGIDKLLFLGSSCIYPREAAQPITEAALLTGPLEPTNEPYAIAKIAGIKLCESYNRQYGTDYRSIMPTNLYGPGDNFHPQNAHVLPALIARFHAAVQNNDESVTIWGTGTPKREFLHADDMADAALFVMNLDQHEYANATLPMQSHINVGTGQDITISALAQMIGHTAEFSGTITFDTTKPDGTMRKLLDTDLLARLGWKPQINLRDGLSSTYDWYVAQTKSGAPQRYA
ncbi:GDP-L-fucose synthase [Yoonia maritima]|uniref:GDP-L-fucose synthase n=1 Tax=Yoonia maritima TaxID=1435347 RepID=UPI000D106E0B|nr:GDP-L-fucose synthase [Yoonia maritima]